LGTDATTSSEKPLNNRPLSDQFFFPSANQSENAKIRFVGGKKIAECEIGH